MLTVLEELGPECDGVLLAAEAEKAPSAWSQRLGHMLDVLEVDEVVTAPLAAQIAERRPVFAALSRSQKRAGAPSDRRWRLVLNVELDPSP